MIMHTKSYRKNHPNPQFLREPFLSLNGEWDFVFDDNDIGRKEDYPSAFPKAGMKITVPYSFEYLSSGIGDKEIHQIVWYHRVLNLEKGKNYLLHFDGVDYFAEVYLNGKLIKTHVGGYSGFAVELKEHILEGDNHLVLRVQDDYSCLHSRGKQRWQDHNYECFYRETTGIYKDVYIEEVKDSYLSSVRMDPSYYERNIKLEFDLSHYKEGLEIETEISYHGKKIVKSREEVCRDIFSVTYDITDDTDTMKVHGWDASYPNLYDVVFRLYHNGEKIDEVFSYFGVANWKASGKSIYSNGDRRFMKLILDQGYSKNGGLTLTEEEMISDIQMMKDIGLNGCRKHEKVESSLFYYYADILGYYLWQELPSAYEYREKTISNLTKEWLDILQEHHNHPSIACLVVFNESWGLRSVKENKEMQEGMQGMYYLTKCMEKNRFVISNDGWEHTDSDLLTLHNYGSTYQALMKEYGKKETDDHRDFYSREVIAHPNGREYAIPGYENRDKPVLLSEFGGIAFEKDKDVGWGYGKAATGEEEYLTRLKGLVDAIFDSCFFSGYCLTQLSDVQQEVNGLLSEEREYKVDKERLKEIFSRND